MSVYDLWYLFFYVFSTNLYPTWSTGYGHHCSVCAAVIGPISFSSRWSIKFYLIIKAVRSAIISHLRCNLSSCSNLHEASGGSKSITGCLWFLYRIQSFIPSHLSCLHPIYLTLILPIMHKYIRQTLWNVSLSSWSIRLVPGAPSSIEVSIWKYHCDPDINQWAPRGGEGRSWAWAQGGLSLRFGSWRSTSTPSPGGCLRCWKPVVGQGCRGRQWTSLDGDHHHHRRLVWWLLWWQRLGRWRLPQSGWGRLIGAPVWSHLRFSAAGTAGIMSESRE